LLAMLVAPVALADEGDDHAAVARRLIALGGLHKGLCLDVGCGDAKLLARQSDFWVHCLENKQNAKHSRSRRREMRIGPSVGIMAFMCMAVASPGLAQTCYTAPARTTLYTKDKAPATPKLEDLPLKDSVSQYGITWTFDKPARVGQFVSCDFYVAGPVTVEAITPSPRYGSDVTNDELDSYEERKIKTGAITREEVVRNGSVLNPPPAQEVGYDSGVRNYYRPSIAAKLPIAMKPGDSLVSTISLKLGEAYDFPYHAGGKRATGDNSPIKVAAMLSCIPAPQPPDAFRPAYCDGKQKIYLSRNLKRDLLAALPRPKSTPRSDTWVRVYQRPWVNTGFFGFDQPMENMPHYGQWVGQAASMAGLMLMLDFSPQEKEPLLIGMVQAGIDYWGAVKSGHPGWQGWGGHGSGRKFPIVFAGLLLGDEEMAGPTKALPKVNFGEDNQTAYGDCWTGAKVVFAGHSGIHADGSVPRRQWGPYEHLPPSQWNQDGMSSTQSEAYRRANSSTSWMGQALVIHMLKAERQWNHDPFFDYCDRWMFEPDKEFRVAIGKAFPKAEVKDSQGWAIQGQAWEPFVTEMWNLHRSDPGMSPTEGWKRKHDDSVYRAAVEKMKNGASTAQSPGAN
jgi:hypothetical protein